MKCISKFVIVFLFFEMSTIQGSFDLNTLEEILKKNNIESEKIDSRKSYVYIDNNAYEIFFYDTSISTEKNYHPNTVLKFYTYLNCEFAKWTRNELFVFVHSHFHVLLNSKSHDHTFNANVVQVAGETQRISKEIDRYIKILSDVADAIRSASIDRSLLIALFAVRFKLDFINTLGKNDGATGLDSKIVQMVLRSVNDVEVYMSLNCGTAAFYDDKMSGAYTKLEPYTVPPGLESNKYRFYSRSNTLMLTALRYLDTQRILYGIRFVEISTGCGDNILLDDLVRRITTTYDLEVIYWYQKFILDITLKLLCDKIIQYLDSYDANYGIPLSVRNSFQTINALLFSKHIGIPADVIYYFKLFESRTQLTEDEVALAKIKIKLYVHDLEMSVNIDKQTYHKNNKKNVKRSRLDKLRSATLQGFLAELELFVSDYEYFMQLYLLLNKEFHSYYAPFVMNYDKITDFVIDNELCRWETGAGSVEGWRQRAHVVTQLQKFFNTTDIKMVFYSYINKDKIITESDISKNVTKSELVDRKCEYTQALIYYCFYVIRNYNTDVTKTDSETFASAYRELDQVRTALLQILTLYPNHHFIKIAYQISPYFNVLGDQFVNESTTGDTLVRMVSLLVNLLNYYGLEHCYPPTHNFVMFSKLFSSAMGTKTSFETVVESFKKDIEHAKTSKLLETDNGNFGSLVRLYETYSNEHEKYENIIQIEWNGNITSIDKIYESISSTLVRPTFFYAFFDVLFKFYLAAIYYETNVFYRCAHDRTIGHSCQSFPTFAENVLEKTDFPDSLQNISDLLSKNLKSVCDELCNKSYHGTESEDITDKIAKSFEGIDVFIKGLNNYEDSSLETDGKNYSVTRRMVCTDLVRNQITSNTVGDPFYAHLQNTIGRILLSVSSMKNLLKRFEIYST